MSCSVVYKFAPGLTAVALMLVASGGTPALAQENQFLDIANLSNETVVISLVDQRAADGFRQLANVPPNGHKRLLGKLPIGLQELHVEFQNRGDSARSGSIQVHNQGSENPFYGKRLRIGRDKGLEKVETVRFLDGLWQIGKKGSDTFLLDLTHVDKQFAGTVRNPKTKQSLPISGAMSAQAITFSIADPDNLDSMKLHGQFRLTPDLSQMEGIVKSTVLGPDGQGGKKWYSVSNAVDIAINAADKVLTVTDIVIQQ